MSLQKQEWPEVGDLVMGTIETVTTYGAYTKLDEYDKRGLIHISEVASSWIRNIRNFVREGQKVVLKVLRVDAGKGHIDLSLRRVTKSEKKEKIMFWKRDRKAETLLREVAEKTGLPLSSIHQNAGSLLEKEYGLYEGLEKTAKDGVDVLTKIGVPDKLAAVIAETAKERIHLALVKVKGIVELRCTKPNGVRIIKEAFFKAIKSKKPKNVKIRFYVIAAPKYCIETMAENYKQAELVLQSIGEKIITNVVAQGGTGIFQREK